jgi:AcrR family transcriptional regulator
LTAGAENPGPPGPRPAGAPEPPPLPRGRHRLPFEFVVENQRRRLLTGAARALGEQGYAALTIKHIIATAGVSRTTFYANFDDKRDCIFAAHRDAFERLVALIMRACATEREWPQKVRAAVSASLALMDTEPGVARLITLNALASDTMIARGVVDSNAHLVTLLRDGRRHTPFGPLLPDLAEEGLIGGLLTILGARVLAGEEGTLAELEPEIVWLLLTPYLGLEEARRVARGEDGTAAAPAAPR